MDLKAQAFWSRVFYTLLFIVVSITSAAITVRVLVKGGDDVEVPMLVGLSAQNAEDALKALHLNLEIEGSQFSDLYPEGSVLYQAMAAGEHVRTQRSIGVFISKGPREREAPRVLGLAYEAAKAILKSADLDTLEPSTTCSDVRSANVVVAQDPAPGSAVTSGKVALLLSNGPCTNRFIMPDLVNYRMNQVVNDFDRSGVIARFFRYQEREDLEPFTILSTEPPPGGVIHTYDSVVFTVSVLPKGTQFGSDGKWYFIRVPTASSLFAKPGHIWLERGNAMSSYGIDFLLTPGENAEFVVWMVPGGSMSLTVEEKEIWHKEF